MKMMSVTSNSTWEDVRKKARQLENEIDAKLLNLNKLSVLSSEPSRSSHIEKAPLLSTKCKIDELGGELEDLLTKLTDVNDLMTANFGASKLTSGGVNGNLANPALLHTIQRHHEILQDYRMEFQRVQSNIRASAEREQLFNGRGPAGKSEFEPGSFNDHRNDDDPYLKEHDHIKSSDRLLDEQISIAMSAKDHLQSQRGGLQEISKKIHHLTKRYPAINSLMQKINWRKRRDTIIIGVVISLCLFFMFIYATRHLHVKSLGSCCAAAMFSTQSDVGIVAFMLFSALHIYMLK